MQAHELLGSSCDLCSASFVERGALREHRAIYHRQLVPSSQQASCLSSASASAASQLGWCMFTGCSAVLTTWEAYADHCRESHAATSLCPICLEAHLEPHRELDVQCPRCPARFVEPSRLLIHKSLYHRVREAAQAPSLRKPPLKAKAKPIEASAKVQCTKCSVWLKNEARLAKHTNKVHPRAGQQQYSSLL